MLLDRIDKEPTDRSRVIVDMSWWLDQGEIITGIISQEVIQGMAGWSEAPYPPRGDFPPPYDPTPLVMLNPALDATKKQLVVFVEFGTAGVAYTLRFVLLGTSQREITVEVGVQVTGVPPEEPKPLPNPPSEAAGQQPGDLYLNIKGGTMQGPLYLFESPKYPTEAVTKNYVDSLTWAAGPFMPEAGGAFTGPVAMQDTLTLHPLDPVNPLEATPKQYVDGKVASMSTAYLPLVGGTLLGPLLLNANPTQTFEAVTKQYVDGLVGGPFVLQSGGTMTGLLLLSGNPAAPTGAATKQYVDGLVRTAQRRLLQWNAGNVLADGTVYFEYSAPYAGTIQALTYATGAGSFNVSVQINGANVTGLNAVLVNSATPATANATGTNTFAAGANITAVLTGTAGAPTGVILSLALLLS